MKTEIKDKLDRQFCAIQEDLYAIEQALAVLRGIKDAKTAVVNTQIEYITPGKWFIIPFLETQCFNSLVLRFWNLIADKKQINCKHSISVFVDSVKENISIYTELVYKDIKSSVDFNTGDRREYENTILQAMPNMMEYLDLLKNKKKSNDFYERIKISRNQQVAHFDQDRQRGWLYEPTNDVIYTKIKGEEKSEFTYSEMEGHFDGLHNNLKAIGMPGIVRTQILGIASRHITEYLILEASRNG